MRTYTQFMGVVSGHVLLCNCQIFKLFQPTSLDFVQLYVTIDVQDTKEVKTDLVNADGTGKLTFSGKTGDVQYELNLPLFSEIDVEASKVSESPRHIFLVIVKVRVAGAGGCGGQFEVLYNLSDPHRSVQCMGVHV